MESSGAGAKARAAEQVEDGFDGDL